MFCSQCVIVNTNLIDFQAIDIVKKWMAQGHELDKEHLAKELGDIAWYLAEAAKEPGDKTVSRFFCVFL